MVSGRVLETGMGLRGEEVGERKGLGWGKAVGRGRDTGTGRAMGRERDTAEEGSGGGQALERG